ncbi:hypothetical protein LTR15_012835 [Elasticomyces elasticus]|nr:hypothetical protein LTR15_012835 [Elasticomyces elasticus]
MQYSLTCLALAALAVAKPMPQGVTSAISPSASAPADCKASYDGTFSIQTVNVTTASKVKRQADDTLVMTLADGILKDSKGRTGYIADNRQFQFDAPPQTGAVYTAGWSVCSNGSLTIGDDSVFYQCLSGTFYNLYDENYLNAAQCSQVYINVIAGSGSSSLRLPSPRRRANFLMDNLKRQALPLLHPFQLYLMAKHVDASTSPSKQHRPPQQFQPPPPRAQFLSCRMAPTTSTVAGAAQASDGQVQASVGANSTFSSPSASVLPYTGNAMSLTIAGEFFGIVAAVMAVAVL